MNNILQYDNGIIAAALKVYASQAEASGSPQCLIDRANDLYFIFTNKSTSEEYKFPEGAEQ